MGAILLFRSALEGSVTVQNLSSDSFCQRFLLLAGVSVLSCLDKCLDLVCSGVVFYWSDCWTLWSLCFCDFGCPGLQLWCFLSSLVSCFSIAALEDHIA